MHIVVINTAIVATSLFQNSMYHLHSNLEMLLEPLLNLQLDILL